MPLAFAKPLLRTASFHERACCLRHYSQVGAVYFILQTISNLKVSINGLSRAHSTDVAYQDVKESRFIIAKNALLVFKLNVLNYITASRAVCKVCLR